MVNGIGILNYTTKISAEKTVAEIEKILAQYGANRIIKDYDGAGDVTSINFIVATDRGHIPVRLPLNLKAVMQAINDQTEQFIGSGGRKRRVVPKSMYNDLAQARRVGWRILKDWLEAQMALIFLQMVKIEEIFLPYIIGIDGKTLYEKIAEKGFEGFLIEDKS